MVDQIRIHTLLETNYYFDKWKCLNNFKLNFNQTTSEETMKLISIHDGFNYELASLLTDIFKPLTELRKIEKVKGLPDDISQDAYNHYIKETTNNVFGATYLSINELLKIHKRESNKVKKGGFLDTWQENQLNLLGIVPSSFNYPKNNINNSLTHCEWEENYSPLNEFLEILFNFITYNDFHNIHTNGYAYPKINSLSYYSYNFLHNIKHYIYQNKNYYRLIIFFSYVGDPENEN